MNANTRADGNVVLVGMPGAGKSTIGVLLAERLGFGFVDTDILMQTGEGQRLQQIIATRGLNGFRRIEERTILSLSIRSHVISTGGSVVYSVKAMEHLKKCGWVCHLDIAPQQIIMRLDNIETRGIVMAPGQTIESLHRERFPLYQQYADIIVDAGHLTPIEILQQIESAWVALER